MSRKKDMALLMVTHPQVSPDLASKLRQRLNRMSARQLRQMCKITAASWIQIRDQLLVTYISTSELPTTAQSIQANPSEWPKPPQTQQCRPSRCVSVMPFSDLARQLNMRAA